ncbi:MAG: flagellar hook-length control protein FliK [Alphaproteobacteria bacterium]|nr:flagellar hook-length control protein FliK [Alphaproteobacteria bacterium]
MPQALTQLGSALFAGLVQVTGEAKAALSGMNNLSGMKDAATQMGSFAQALAAMEGAINPQQTDLSGAPSLLESGKMKKAAGTSSPVAADAELTEGAKLREEDAAIASLLPAGIQVAPAPKQSTGTDTQSILAAKGAANAGAEPEHAADTPTSQNSETAPAIVPCGTVTPSQSAQMPAAASSEDVAPQSTQPIAASPTLASPAPVPATAPVALAPEAAMPGRQDDTNQTAEKTGTPATAMSATESAVDAAKVTRETAGIATLAAPTVSEAKATLAMGERGKARANGRVSDDKRTQGASPVIQASHEAQAAKGTASLSVQPASQQSAAQPSSPEAPQQAVFQVETRANTATSLASQDPQVLDRRVEANAPQQIAHIAVHIAKNAKAGNAEFKIRLSPEELGSIDVKLEMSQDGRLRASLMVERPETLDLLTRDAKSLEQSLRQSGLDLSGSDLNFSLKEERSEGQERQSPFARAMAMKEEVAEAAIESTPQYQPSRSLLDIRV